MRYLFLLTCLDIVHHWIIYLSLLYLPRSLSHLVSSVLVTRVIWMSKSKMTSFTAWSLELDFIEEVSILLTSRYVVEGTMYFNDNATKVCSSLFMLSSMSLTHSFYYEWREATRPIFFSKAKICPHCFLNKTLQPPGKITLGPGDS